MKIFRILLHSLVLAIVNLGSIIVGFYIYYILKPANQIAVQVPFAMIFSIIAFLLWSVLVRRLPIEHLSLQGRNEFGWTFLFALVWSPVIFVPLHFITQGYLTSFGNILGAWFFQIPTNLLAILMVNKLVYAGNDVDEITLTSGDSG